MPPKLPEPVKYVDLFEKAYADDNYSQAVCYAEFALDLYYSDPDFYPDFELADLHNSLGVALSRLNKDYAAIPHFLKALELERSATIFENLGASYSEIAAYEKAIQVYEQAIELAPKNPCYYYRRARASVHAGRMDMHVLDDCKKAYELETPLKTLMEILNTSSSKKIIDCIENLDDVVQKTELLQTCLDQSSLLGHYFFTKPALHVQRITKILHSLSAPYFDDPVEKLKAQDLRELRALGFFNYTNYSKEVTVDKLFGDFIHKMN